MTRIPETTPLHETAGMAATFTSFQIDRLSLADDSFAADTVDAAFVNLEPGASVASPPSLDADDAGAAPSDSGRTPAAARGVTTLLRHHLLGRRPDAGRRPRLRARPV